MLSREQALAAFGPLLGNTKILVDHTGTVVMADSYTTVEAVPVMANDGYCPADDEYCVDGPYGDPNQRYRCIGERCDTYNYVCCLDEVIAH